MKVNYRNCEFGKVAPFSIPYKGRCYRGLDLSFVNDAGIRESIRIAEGKLEDVLDKGDGDFDDLDVDITYYADDEEDIYTILETVTNEKIEFVKNPLDDYVKM